MSHVFDATPCKLGEGPLWHPEREELFWFDVLNHQLLSRDKGEARVWQFAEHVSAAGWVSHRKLLVAAERELFTFDLETGHRAHVCGLEADNPITRSNDGRADPWGGFWIGTMGFKAENSAGSIYRYYRGELRRILPDLTITNAISFDPDGVFACYCDTAEHVIRKIRLNEADGWPVGESEIFIDMRGENWGPDGAVIDVEGNFWNAQWGASRVAVYDRSGTFIHEEVIGARQSSCPAFGGPELSTLFVTSATEGLLESELREHPESGMTFATEVAGFQGQKEHKVIL